MSTSSTVAPAVEEAIPTLRGAVLVLARRMRAQQVGDELSPTEAAVVGRLGRNGPMTPGQLAREEHVQPPSMTRIIDRLVERRLIRRDPHPDDRRQFLISRTPAADDLFAASRELRNAWLTRQFALLDPASQALLAAAAPALALLAEL